MKHLFPKNFKSAERYETECELASPVMGLDLGRM